MPSPVCGRIANRCPRVGPDWLTCGLKLAGQTGHRQPSWAVIYCQAMTQLPVSQDGAVLFKTARDSREQKL